MIVIVVMTFASALSFGSFKFPVFIEATDAFGMVFYANFPVLVERFLIDQAQGEHSDNQLVSFKQMKLKIPGRLGDMLRLESDESGKISCRNQDEKELFTAIKAKLGDGLHTQIESSSFIGQHRSTFQLWPDEHKGSLCLPTRTIFNLFERGRTDILGGPSKLHAAQTSNNHVYVARIQQYYHHALSLKEPIVCRAEKLSAMVVSETAAMGDSIVDFNQKIECNGLTIASAKITCVSVDARTGAPSPFASDLAEVLFR